MSTRPILPARPARSAHPVHPRRILLGLLAVACLALGRPTTASSVEPTTTYEGRFATDGDGATRWSSGYDDVGWIQVDLGSVQPVNRVRLAWEPTHARAYQVQVPADGTNWSSLYSTAAGDGGLDDLTGLAGSGRYVRMLGTARATQWGYSLWSFEVYS